MLTYKHANLDPTALGYTQKSSDRIWFIVTVETGEGGDKITKAYKGNWVYLAEKFSSYDPMDDTLIFLSRREAQAHLDTLPEKYRPHWHTVNLGDMVRHESAYLQGERVGLDGTGFTPKFRGSDAAFALKREVGLR